MLRILFVCTGNTCRSCMAEALFKHAAKVYQNNNKYGGLEVSSAGISAFDGDTASFNSIKVLDDQWEVDISSHKARRLMPEMVQEADLVLAMTVAHRDELIRRFSSCKGKIFTVKEYINKHIENEYKDNLNISDPFGGDVEVYKDCSIEIKEAVSKLAKILFD